jgi:hypothetical protein
VSAVMEQLQEEIVTECQAQRPQTVFDWGILITALLPMVIEWLTSCFKSKSREEVRKMVQEQSFWTRYAVRVCVNRASEDVEEQYDVKIGGKDKRVARGAVLAKCSQMSEDARWEAVTGDITENNYDPEWGM